MPVETVPLPAVRLMLNKLAIQLMPLTHQLNALPDDNQLEYYFVPSRHMKMFAPYYRPGQPYKNFKLLNYERPAISLSFYVKHKYRLDRNVSPQRAVEYLRDHRDQLFEQTFLNPAGGLERELRETDALLRAIRDAPDGYQFCLSNYHHYYRYWYCSFRYFEDEACTKTGTDNEHLLKHTERIKGKVSERINVIFIDENYITRPVPLDNKMADRELDTYPQRFTHGTVALYVKPKA